MKHNTRCGVLEHILGLRKDQLAREPKGKTLPGGVVVLRARTVFALVLSLQPATASDGSWACRIISIQ
jgi:hypothetical protein